ncbi:MAG: PD40 domain-containing protein [Gemmatimonadetes bacterium]|nr:PD40 domain-containing protein [Gemmatimonadota bacterium]
MTELLEGELAHLFFGVLPGGKMGVFQVLRDLTGEGSEVWAIDLETRERTFLTAGITPRYASTGHLLFATSDGVLMARPIDPATAEFTGPAVPVAEGLVMRGLGFANYAVSESETLIYEVGGADAVAGEGLFEPVWVTRSGEAAPVDPGWRFNLMEGFGLRLSPDGTRVAITQRVDGNEDVWIKQLPDGPLERLTSDDLIDTSPFWSPDGEFVAYSRGDGSTGFDIWQRRADGTGAPELLLDDERSLYQGRWSPDGEWMIFRTDSYRSRTVARRRHRRLPARRGQRRDTVGCEPRVLGTIPGPIPEWALARLYVRPDRSEGSLRQALPQRGFNADHSLTGWGAKPLVGAQRQRVVLYRRRGRARCG